LFNVYHSNQIDILKSLLVELIRVNPLDTPFEKEQILVQSPGMSQWLKIELAKEMGIAANLAFPLPATFIWDMFVNVLDDVPKKSAFNKESMTWKLMSILPEQLSKPEFTPLNSYLVDDQDQSKLYQLSEKIADIFDGYLVYRPDWITAWEQDREIEELHAEQPWQKKLWQALHDHTVALGQSPYHRANLYDHFIETLEHGAVNTQFFPKRLFIFGISSIPPRYMDALAAIGKHTEVHLMFTNPCRYYWGDVRDRKYLAKLVTQKPQMDHLGEAETIGNSLLASMGKLGRDNIYLLSNLSSSDIDAFVEIDRDSLLHNVHADILSLEERQDDQKLLSSDHKKGLEAKDDSITLHACHSPMREVEILHDNLLAMFEDNPELKPRDIIVMVADVNEYSAAIQAVFGNAPGPRYIPFSISDRSASQESPILGAFLRLLELPQSRCSASELLELLETPEILSQFGLSESEFERGKLWVEETEVRWGLNKQTAQDFDLPDREQNTWLFGIQRMLLGYAMHDSVDIFHCDQQSIAPYSEVQGMDAEIAGKLAHFVDKISDYRSKFSTAHSISQWQSLLYALMDDFFLVDLEGEVALKSIRDSLQQLADQLDDSVYQSSLSPRVLTDYIQAKLSGSKVSQRFLAGQVNFCTLMPMRSIPFEVVCLLGMNDGDYPRVSPKEGLDLMNNRSRPGDRSRRDDDRYLFLEALLSAQSKLYISYIARSIQDNSPRAPSILVSELLEYCGQNYCFNEHKELPSDDSSTALIQSMTSDYPMVPFSEQAFSSHYQSYAKEWLPSVNRKGRQPEPFIQTLSDYRDITEQPEALSLLELQRFWRLPVKTFFNRRLKVYFEQQATSIQDEEPFSLNNLESYSLRNDAISVLLDARLHNLDEETVYTQFMQKQRANGSLPVGAFGELDLDTNRQKVDQVVSELALVTQSPLDDIEVDVQIALDDWPLPINLSGWLTGNYQSGLVRYRSGKIRSQDWLLAWIDHLCLAVANESKPTHIIGIDAKVGLEHKVILPVERAEATQCLSCLIQYYFQGMNAPLAYFPKTALAGMERVVSAKDDAIDKMASSFNDGWQFEGEGSNNYIRRVWPEWNEQLFKQVNDVATNILLNMIKQTKNSDEKE
jgi:exodeoxyribonuclease V gamma subunit